MTSKGKRVRETRGQYPRCTVKGCKQKEVRDGLCSLHAALADPARMKQRPEGREGIVTVYDDQDRYLGCMGIELWQRLLAEEVELWQRPRLADSNGCKRP